VANRERRMASTSSAKRWWSSSRECGGGYAQSAPVCGTPRRRRLLSKLSTFFPRSWVCWRSVSRASEVRWPSSVLRINWVSGSA